MEDYFLGSYGFPKSFSTAYSGTVLPADFSGSEPPNLWSLYRWHIQDPINFDDIYFKPCYLWCKREFEGIILCPLVATIW